MADRKIQLAPDVSDREAWLERGRGLARRRSEESWALADWIREGVDLMGPGAVAEAAGITGSPVRKIYNYLRTSITYDLSRRRDSLTFSHHSDTAALPEEARERLLDAAEAGSWSRAELRGAVREQSLEAENGRLKDRVADLERRLRVERMDPADALEATKRVERVVGDITRQAVRGAERHLAEWQNGAAFRSLHGNARRAAVRRLARRLTDAASRIRAMASLDPDLPEDGE